MQSFPKPRILFVDDDELWLLALQRILRHRTKDWEVVCTSSAIDALAACQAQPFQVVVTDMNMPGIDGPALLQQIGALHPDTVQMILSASDENDSRRSADLGAVQYVNKTAGGAALVESIHRALAIHTLIRRRAINRLLDVLRSVPYLTDLFIGIRSQVDANGTLRATAEISCPSLEIEYRVPLVTHDTVQTTS